VTQAPGDRTARQAELFDALVAIFLGEGFSGLTLDQLADRLRCSKTTLYALAPSKEQLARAVVLHFFRSAAEGVERSLASVDGAAERVAAYLDAVAVALAPASSAFHRDLDRFPPARELYERNTALAARRVGELIADGVRAGAFREVHAAFVADTVAATMMRIGRGEIAASTGLDDASAYRELADLVLHGVHRSSRRR
jgi:AcrR family transcriptional regulator